MSHLIAFTRSGDGRNIILNTSNGRVWDWSRYEAVFPGRASLAEQRFDHNGPEVFATHHPLLAWLLLDREADAVVGVVGPDTIVPPVEMPEFPAAEVPEMPVAPGTPSMPVVPEPGSGLLVVIALVVALAAWVVWPAFFGEQCQGCKRRGTQLFPDDPNRPTPGWTSCQFCGHRQESKRRDPGGWR